MNATTCGQPSLYWTAVDVSIFMEFTILLPVYAVVCVIGHSMALVSFCKETATQKAYVYQILLTVFGLLEGLAIVMHKTVNAFGGTSGYEWYRRMYALMFYKARMSLPLLHGFSMTALLISCFMAADRVFALAKPFLYKNYNHRRLQALALIFSLVFGFAITFNITFLGEVRKSVSSDGSDPSVVLYETGVNRDWAYSTTGLLLNLMTNFFRVVALLILIGLNIHLVRLYRRRLGKIAQMANHHGQQRKQQQETAAKKKAENSLNQLTFLQSSFSAINMTIYVLPYAVIYFAPSFAACSADLYGPFNDSMQMLAVMTNTVAVLFLDKECRCMLRKAFYFVTFRTAVTSLN